MPNDPIRKYWYLFLAWFIVLIIGHIFSYSRTYVITPIEQGVSGSGVATSTADFEPPVQAVPSKAWFKPWTGRQYAYGEAVAQEDLGQAVETLIDCERPADPTACIMDTNGKESCGVLQYQWDTWNAWEAQFGEHGDPRNQLDARVMAYKALAAGYAHRWSCSRLVGLML